MWDDEDDDEFDEEERRLLLRPEEHAVILSANYSIGDANAVLEQHFPDYHIPVREDYELLSGYVNSLFLHIPEDLPTAIPHKDLQDPAHRHGLTVHLDGARFANALAALDTTPAAMTWQSGIDVLSFGATKSARQRLGVPSSFCICWRRKWNFARAARRDSSV